MLDSCQMVEEEKFMVKKNHKMTLKSPFYMIYFEHKYESWVYDMQIKAWIGN